MNADRIGAALKGRRHGKGWLVSCPCPNHGKGHGDRNPSLSVSDGDGDRLLMRCFAGCEFNDIMDALRGHRLLATSNIQKPGARQAPRIVTKVEPDKIALEIWQMSGPIHGTIAEEYLQRRGITLTPPALGHYRGSMIARVEQPYVGITAIQKTPINPDCTRGERWTKGPLGAGAVRLGAAQRIMGIAEGTETALSAMMLTGMTVWASLGGKRLHNVELPPIVEQVHIFSDNDQPGREAAERAAEVHRDLGRTVKVRRPPSEFKDYNDYIIADADAWQKELP
jgi:putative DNA primase/helicase